MNIDEAKAKLQAVITELDEAGFAVWGYDDESINIGERTDNTAFNEVIGATYIDGTYNR